MSFKPMLNKPSQVHVEFKKIVRNVANKVSAMQHTYNLLYRSLIYSSP